MKKDRLTKQEVFDDLESTVRELYPGFDEARQHLNSVGGEVVELWQAMYRRYQDFSQYILDTSTLDQAKDYFKHFDTFLQPVIQAEEIYREHLAKELSEQSHALQVKKSTLPDLEKELQEARWAYAKDSIRTSWWTKMVFRMNQYEDASLKRKLINQVNTLISGKEQQAVKNKLIRKIKRAHRKYEPAKQLHKIIQRETQSIRDLEESIPQLRESRENIGLLTTFADETRNALASAVWKGGFKHLENHLGYYGIEYLFLFLVQDLQSLSSTKRKRTKQLVSHNLYPPYSLLRKYSAIFGDEGFVGYIKPGKLLERKVIGGYDPRTMLTYLKKRTFPQPLKDN